MRRLPVTEAGKEMRLNLAENLRLIRERRGLTQAALAEAAQLHRCHINRIEGGYCAVALDTLASIAEALDVPARTLIEPVKLSWDDLPRRSLTARNIRYQRRLKSMSIRDLADAAGFSRAHLHAIEDGNLSVSTEDLKALSDALEIRTDDLLNSWTKSDSQIEMLGEYENVE